MGRHRRLLTIVVLSLLGLGVLGAIAIGGSSRTTTKRTLTLSVRGGGSIIVGQGSKVCHRLCRRRMRAPGTISIRAQPNAGNRFVRWTGGCAHGYNHYQCVVQVHRARTLVAHFAAIKGLVSWNPYYARCKPELTTIPSILGSQRGSLGGATEAGGAFQPHMSGPADQHLLNPPCSIGGTTTFVEIHNVVLAENPERSGDGDESMNMSDPNRPDITSTNMKTIHTEIDHLLFENGVAPPIPPPQGAHVDIQGFVFWDPAHVHEPWHSYSGWEIHTITAWQRAR